MLRTVNAGRRRSRRVLLSVSKTDPLATLKLTPSRTGKGSRKCRWNRGKIVAPPHAEVPMVEPEVVRQMRLLHEAGWGAKRIAPSSASRATPCGATCAVPARGRPGAAVARGARRRCSAREARELFDGDGRRQCRRRAAAARRARARRRACGRCSGPSRRTVASSAPPRWRRFASRRRPAHQMQIDFGEKWVCDRAAASARVTCSSPCSATRGGSSCGRFCSQRHGRLARGHRRRVPALRRRHADGARRQRSRRSSLGRDRATGVVHVPPGVPRVLPRLGRRAARVPAVSSTHEGQDGVRRRAT